MKRTPAPPAETDFHERQEARQVANMYRVLAKPGMIRYAGGWFLDKLLTMGPFGIGAARGTFRTYQTTYEHPEHEGGFISAEFSISRENTKGDITANSVAYSDHYFAGQATYNASSSLSVLMPSGKKSEDGNEIFTAEHFQIGGSDPGNLVVERPPSLMVRNDKGFFEGLPYEEPDREAILKQAVSVHDSGEPLSELLRQIDRSTATSAVSLKLETYAPGPDDARPI